MASQAQVIRQNREAATARQIAATNFGDGKRRWNLYGEAPNGRDIQRNRYGSNAGSGCSAGKHEIVGKAETSAGAATAHSRTKQTASTARGLQRITLAGFGSTASGRTSATVRIL